MSPPVQALWSFFPWGLMVSIAIETPVLLIGLSARHPRSRRLFAGFWLTACTYPIVCLVLPILVWEPLGRMPYLLVAETFAPIAECLLFLAAFPQTNSTEVEPTWVRDCLAIVAANLTSFLSFEIYTRLTLSP